MVPADLDDLQFLTRLDPKGMLGLTLGFADQCRRALTISSEAHLPPLEARPGLVMLTGLGGSAAGGDFVRSLFEAQATVPFLVNRDYALPRYVGLGDLVFCASYSGNTEETLAAFDDARSLGARVIAVTSGGELAARAERAGCPVIQIPGGQPPRTALGFMMVPVIEACARLNLLPAIDFDNLFASLDRCSSEWGPDKPETSNQAKLLARKLHGKLPVIYGLGSWQGLVANRWKGQINENAKNLALTGTYPELNHNEILGWVESKGQGVRGWAGVLLEDGTESKKMQARAATTERLLDGQIEFTHVRAMGRNLIERMLSLVYLGDFVSIYLAALNGIDPESIDWINMLKSELANV